MMHSERGVLRVCPTHLVINIICGSIRDKYGRLESQFVHVSCLGELLGEPGVSHGSAGGHTLQRVDVEQLA